MTDNWNGIERRQTCMNGNMTKLKELTASLSSLSHFVGSGIVEYDTDKGKIIGFKLLGNDHVGIIKFISESGTILKNHVHLMNEWIGISEGEAEVEFDNKIHTIKQYEVLMIPANTKHTFKTPVNTIGFAVTMPSDKGYFNGK